MEDLGIRSLPPLRTINRIINKYNLTNRRTDYFEPKGKRNPVPQSINVNHVHQSDFMKPCYLNVPTRFISIIQFICQPNELQIKLVVERDAQSATNAFLAIW
jgi:hypothetical protein